MIKSKFCIGNPELPLMALAIHNGHDMPRELMDICGISDTERLQEEDPYTALISEKCGNYITVLSSRFMVDLNRSPQKAVYQKPEDCWGLPVRKSEIPGDYLAKLYQAYDQWYALLGYNIEKLLQRHEHLIVLDIHSYNHRRGGTTAPPDPQIDNPDLILGRSNMPMEHYPAVAKLRHRLHGKMLGNRVLDCREDIKFTGGNLSRYLHDKYDGKVMSISIEFKKIFMDEWTGLLDEVIFGEFIALFWDSIKGWLRHDLEVQVSGSDDGTL